MASPSGPMSTSEEGSGCWVAADVEGLPARSSRAHCLYFSMSSGKEESRALPNRMLPAETMEWTGVTSRAVFGAGVSEQDDPFQERLV